MSRWVEPAQPDVVAEGDGAEASGPAERLVKYVPAEVLAPYTALVAGLGALGWAGKQQSSLAVSLLVAFLVVTVVRVAMGAPREGSVRRSHLFVSPVAFLAWGYPIAACVLGPFFEPGVAFGAGGIGGRALTPGNPQNGLTMHRLEQELNENGELSGVVFGLSGRVAGNPGKMGLLLDLNPLWRWSARFAAAGIEPDGWWPGWAAGADLVGPDGGGALDFAHRSELVEAVVEHIGGRSREPAYQPFLLRLVARPECSRDDREGLLAAARETEILTVVNTHPVPQLIAGVGSELTSKVTGKSGTLGGFLSDNAAGEHFAVTCGHVGTWGDFTSTGVILGAVIAAQAPTPLPAGVRCHAGCGSVTELDLTLIRRGGEPGDECGERRRGCGQQWRPCDDGWQPFGNADLRSGRAGGGARDRRSLLGAAYPAAHAARRRVAG